MPRDFWVSESDRDNMRQIRTDRTGHGRLAIGEMIRGRYLDVWGRSIVDRSAWVTLVVLGYSKVFPGKTPTYIVEAKDAP